MLGGCQLGKHSSNSDNHESQHCFNAYVDQTHVKCSAQSGLLSPPEYPLSKHDCTPHIIWMVEVSLAALSALSKLTVSMCMMQDSNLAS